MVSSMRLSVGALFACACLSVGAPSTAAELVHVRTLVVESPDISGNTQPRDLVAESAASALPDVALLTNTCAETAFPPPTEGDSCL